MYHKVLVAYATKYGSTADIAEQIADVLAVAGIDVDVRLVDDVETLRGYTAVVLGSAVYVGKWRKEAARFLEAKEPILSHMPVWLFSSGPTGEGNPVELMDGWHFPETLQPIADRIQPRDIVCFSGALDARRLNLIERFMIRAVKAPIGDFRDWNAVEAWAAGVARSLHVAAKEPVYA